MSIAQSYLDFFANQSDKKNHFLITILATLLFVPFLGLVPLFDWDEVNFAEAAREMVITGNYFQVHINFEIFLEKPPLFFWLQALCMHIFGINEFASRLPNAIFGIITLNILYVIGCFWADKKTALLWVIAYMGTILPHFYFKTAIIDPVFNLFIFLGLFFLYRLITEKKIKFAIYAGFFVGLGVLTKGPVALLIPILSIGIHLIMRRGILSITWLEILVFLGFAGLISSLWLLPEILNSGLTFIYAFVQRHIDLLSTSDAGHGQPFYYHPIVLFFGCFPSAVILLMAIFDKNTKINANNDSGLLMKIMFWVVLIIFSIVKTKIVHYSSLTYFPLTYIAVRYLLVKDFTVLPRFWKYIQMLSGLPIVLATLLFPWFIAFADVFTPYIDDPFAVENFKIDGGWTGFETLIGFLALFFWVKMILNLTKQKWLDAVVFTYFGMVLVVQMTLLFDVPKLEKHIQGALIDFLKSKRDEKCIVRTINFKSYAQYFYAEVKEGQPKEANQNEWLLNGRSSIPIYLITKADRDEFRKHEKLRFLYEKGGFIFYERIF